MELQEAYKVMQANCGIGVGDTVRVLREVKNGELGWRDGWNCDMDSFVGNTCLVASKNHDSFTLSFEGSNWFFPFFVLELIEKAKPVKTITIDGKSYAESDVIEAVKQIKELNEIK